jgi:hypothetical protein
MSIFESKAEVASFCLELSKKLDMRYQSPPLPVDLLAWHPISHSLGGSNPTTIRTGDTQNQNHTAPSEEPVPAQSDSVNNHHGNDDSTTAIYQELVTMMYGEPTKQKTK